MSEGLNAANFAQTTLGTASSSGATSLVTAGLTGFPPAPFIIAVQDNSTASIELMLVTVVSGANLTVTPAYEGTTASAHLAGASISVVLTADMYMQAMNNGNEVPQNGSTLQMGRYDFIYAVNATQAGSITPPTNPVPLREYVIIDVGNNFGTYNQNFNSGQQTLGAGNQNGSSYRFVYLPTAQAFQQIL